MGGSFECPTCGEERERFVIVCRERDALRAFFESVDDARKNTKARLKKLERDGINADLFDSEAAELMEGAG